MCDSELPLYIAAHGISAMGSRTVNLLMGLSVVGEIFAKKKISSRKMLM